MDEFALSIKQPWATLLVHGIKTIEIRGWPTRRRGPVLIHAAKVADSGERGWSFSPELRQAAELSGGIIGAGDLTDCITYGTAQAFADDEALHRNHPDWFRAPALYGFRFENLRTLPFRPLPGWVRFFRVPS